MLPQTCVPATVSMTSTPDASGFVTLDSTSMNFQIQTTDMTHIGSYQVTVTATIPFETSPGSGTLVNDTFDFNIRIEDACETTTLVFDPTVSDMLVYVGLAAET